MRRDAVLESQRPELPGVRHQHEPAPPRSEIESYLHAKLPETVVIRATMKLGGGLMFRFDERVVEWLIKPAWRDFSCPLFIIFQMLARWQALAADTFRGCGLQRREYSRNLPPPGRPRATPPKPRCARAFWRSNRTSWGALEEFGSPAPPGVAGLVEKPALTWQESEFVTGHDTNVQVAVLSRFPIMRATRTPMSLSCSVAGGSKSAAGSPTLPSRRPRPRVQPHRRAR